MTRSLSKQPSTALLVAVAWMQLSASLHADEVLVNGKPILLQRDLRYRAGGSRAWTLDLARPKEPSSHGRAGIVVIHGGGWIEGDKSSFSTADRRVPGNIVDFALQGFTAATINYRLAGEAPYPAALDDCRSAVRWLRAHSTKFDLDPRRIGAYGNSAGGHLALMLALTDADDSDRQGPHANQTSKVSAAASDSGPLDLVRQHRQNQLRTVVERFMAGSPEGTRLERYRQASPSNYVSARVPPLLLMYGENDEQVDVATADAFVAALSRVGAKNVSYFRLAKVGHCPHSIARVSYLPQAVNEFFLQALKEPTSR